MTGGGMFATNFYPKVGEHSNGKSLNGFYLGKDTGITPGFVNHLILTITDTVKSPHVIDLMREVKDKEFKRIPVTQISDINELPK